MTKTILLFILFSFRLPSIFANIGCEIYFSQLSKLANHDSIFEMRKTLKSKIKPFNKYGNIIHRIYGRRKINDWDNSGTISAYIEFPINLITFLHPIPNPLNIKSSWKNVDHIKQSIQKKGFDLDQTIVIKLLPNGTFLCVSGHHRIRAMYEMGETTVPVTLESYHHSESIEKETLEYLIYYHAKQLPHFDGSFESFIERGNTFPN
ncbi:MAG: ParB N-terminal domain-containing protein [Halobacteriovoraceae bacterium]|nr:ParB N-terminal domain-containing protein [Halobacteriovoraceae bacterium]